MSSRARWETIAENRRMRLNGKEEAEPRGELLYSPRHHGEAQRAGELLVYLKTSPRGERDVEPILDRLEAARAEKAAWLRGVLDCCED